MHSTKAAPSLHARLVALSATWEEQSQLLYWSIRDLGGDPATLLAQNPFEPALGRVARQERLCPCTGWRA